MPEMPEIGLVGAGVMGSMIARAIDAGECQARLLAVTDLDPDRARGLASSLGCRPEVLSRAQVVRRCGLVVEAAAPGVLQELLEEVIEHRRDLMVLSIGGLIDLDDSLARAARRGCRIYCPSGAIAGLDAVRAGALGKIEGARITTRKPPAGLAGTPAAESLDLVSLAEPRVVFEGAAREACRAFPQNVNVSAALSLAGIGVDRTRVRIIADPGVDRNIHTVEVWGDFGRIETRTENVPSANPRTSRLAALSAIALIKRMSSSLQIGS